MKEKTLKVCDFVIYWSIVIMPFSVAIAPGVANTFIGLFSAFFVIKKIIEKKPLGVDKAVLVPFIFLFVISLFSFVNSVSFSASFNGIIKLLKYFLIFAVCCQEIRDKEHIGRIVFSICCGISLMAIDAIWQIFSGYDFVHGNALQSCIIDLARPTASFPNPNVFGVYMTALAPLAIGLTIFYFKGGKRALMFLTSLLAISGVYLTLSRGAGLAIYASILFLSVSGKKKFLTFALVAIIIIFPFVMPKHIKQWAKEINYNPLVFMCNQDRISIYSNTVNMIKHHPFLGVGINTFSRNYGKYKTESAEKYAHTPDTIYSHNIYLQMAGETGLLGLFSFLWFLFVVFKQAMRSFRKLDDPYLKAAAISLVACIIGFLVNGLTETSLYYARVSMVFWYLIGVSLALGRLSVSHEK
ncbi:MAG: O-antigen ligase family protein [Candidatus Omnitrophota bacterium]